MKKLVLIVWISVTFLGASAQESAVKVTSERQSDRSVRFSYTKTDPGSFSIIVKFSQLENATSLGDRAYTVSGTVGTVFTLSPTNKDNGISYQYSYRYVRGKLNPKFDPGFCYLLPYAPSTKCQVSEAAFANERYFGAERPADWKSYFFYTENEEMVTAARKGMVVEIVDKYENDENVEYTTQKNSIIVEHEDGTLARYRGLKKGSLKVRVGDVIFPNMPLGLNTSNSKNGFGVSIFMYYLNSLDFESLKGQSLTTHKSLYGIITPKFSVGNDQCMILENRKTYQSFSSEALVTKEMSKKELKNYKQD